MAVSCFLWWKSILCASFVHHFVCSRLRVQRARNSRYTNLAAAAPVISFVGGSVMVWGAISWQHRSALVLIKGALTGQRYFNETSRIQRFICSMRHRCTRPLGTKTFDHQYIMLSMIVSVNWKHCNLVFSFFFYLFIFKKQFRRLNLCLIYFEYLSYWITLWL